MSSGAGTSLVSVVVPTFKRSGFLGRAIESVLAQTYSNFELIVVDDNEANSPFRQRVKERMARFVRDERVRYLQHDRNRGGAAARNSGIKAASGEYVAFLDDDDEWHPTKLEKQLACLEASPPQTALAYVAYRKVLADTGNTIDVFPDPATATVRHLLARNTIGTTSLVLCRKSALLDVGLFDEALPSRQDVDLYVRLAQAYRFAYVPEILVTWYRHEGESIGKNVDGAIRAHRSFQDKHFADIRRYPDAHAERLAELGKLLLEKESFGEARKLFLNAARLSPPNWNALRYLLLANRLGREAVLLRRLLKERLRKAVGSGKPEQRESLPHRG